MENVNLGPFCLTFEPHVTEYVRKPLVVYKQQAQANRNMLILKLCFIYFF